MDGTCFNTLVYRNYLKAFYSEYHEEGEGTDTIRSPIDDLIELLECDGLNSWEEEEGSKAEGSRIQGEFIEKLKEEED